MSFDFNLCHSRRKFAIYAINPLSTEYNFPFNQYVQYLPVFFVYSAKDDSIVCLFVCVGVLRPSQPNGIMSSWVSLPNHKFTGQA